MTRAIVLAAGRSSRAGQISGGRPKCLLDIHGTPLVRRTLDLLESCGLRDTWIVTGFGAGAVMNVVGEGVNFRYYGGYARTNNLGTLASCADLIDRDVMILFSDVLVSRDVMMRCLASPGCISLIVDRTRVLAGTMRVKTHGDIVSDIGPHIPTTEGNGNFTGIARISASCVQAFRNVLGHCAADSALENAYYTECFRQMSMEGHKIGVVDTRADEWFEVDTPEDYDHAISLEFYRPLQSRAIPK